MKYIWRQYGNSINENSALNSLLDDEAKRMTGMDEGFADDYAYWSAQNDASAGEIYRLFLIYPPDGGELIERSSDIVGREITRASAVIFPNNTASIRAFEHAGFHFERSHDDGDAWYYGYCRG